MKNIKHTVKASLGLLLGISLITNASMLVIPLFSLQIFDRVLGSGSFETLYMLLSAAILVGLFYCYFEYRRQYLPTEVLQLVFSNAQQSLAKSSCKNGNAVVYQDLSKLLSCNINGVLLAAVDACFCPLFLVVLYLLHPSFALLVGSVNILLLVVFTLQQKYLVMSQASFQGKQKKHFQEMDELVRTAKNLRADNRILNWVKNDHAGDLNTSALKMKTKENHFKCLFQFIKWALQLSLPTIGGILLLNNEISTGTLLAALIIGYRGLIPFEVLLSQWQLSSRLISLYKRFQVHQKECETTVNKTMPLTKLSGQITVEELSIKLDEQSRELLSNVNINIESGEAIAIIGANGSGKTLLIDAMTGVSPKYKGHVYFDEYNRENVNEKWLGPQIGYVPQNLLVASDTIQQVIAHYLQDKLNPDRVVEVAEQLGIHKFILSLPKGYDTVIGLHGEPIPPGILQRILIASAIYTQPKYLFFDEADAFLDQEGQQIFKNLIISFREVGCTVIYSTQKRSLVDIADGVILMDRGKARNAAEVEGLNISSVRGQA
jgi:ABC-type protease/lipase transport system fused ATPase/permease subunit